jgi:hypothetical protein
LVNLCLLSDLKDILEDYDLIPTVEKTVPTLEDKENEIMTEKDLTLKFEMAGPVLKDLILKKELVLMKNYLKLKYTVRLLVILLLVLLQGKETLLCDY